MATDNFIFTFSFSLMMILVMARPISRIVACGQVLPGTTHQIAITVSIFIRTSHQRWHEWRVTHPSHECSTIESAMPEHICTHLLSSLNIFCQPPSNKHECIIEVGRKRASLIPVQKCRRRLHWCPLQIFWKPRKKKWHQQWILIWQTSTHLPTDRFYM